MDLPGVVLVGRNLAVGGMVLYSHLKMQQDKTRVNPGQLQIGLWLFDLPFECGNAYNAGSRACPSLLLT